MAERRVPTPPPEDQRKPAPPPAPPKVQRFVCGGMGDLPPESEAELREFERYLLAGGKRAWGSFHDWQQQNIRGVTTPIHHASPSEETK